LQALRKSLMRSKNKSKGSKALTSTDLSSPLHPALKPLQKKEMIKMSKSLFPTETLS
jgi:hypothetical protein